MESENIPENLTSYSFLASSLKSFPLSVAIAILMLKLIGSNMFASIVHPLQTSIAQAQRTLQLLYVT